MPTVTRKPRHVFAQAFGQCWHMDTLLVAFYALLPSIDRHSIEHARKTLIANVNRYADVLVKEVEKE